jgi:hypothetical protein
MKNWRGFRNQIREKPTSITVMTTCIGEGIVLLAMAMKIEADINPTSLA